MENYTFNVLISIPSYHRTEMLIEALRSIGKNLAHRVPDVRFYVHAFVQDASEAEQEWMMGQAKAIASDSFDLSIEFAPKQAGYIGKIVRTAALSALNWYSRTVRSSAKSSRPNFLLLSDDDILVQNETENFGETFHQMLCHMADNNVTLGSAKLGAFEPSVRFFPQDELHTPFKERFILLNMRSHNQTPQCSVDKPDWKVLLNTELEEFSVGEDLFFFVKAMIAGFKIGLYEGLLDYWHLPHMDQQREQSKLKGGFIELARDYANKHKVSEANKYDVVGSRTQATVQHKFPDIFDWRRVNDFLNPLRPDVLRFVQDHYFIDQDLYTTHQSTYRMYRERNIRMLFDSIQQDEYEDTAQLEVRDTLAQDYAPDGLIEFVRRNVKHPALEIGPGSGTYLTAAGVVAEAFLEPSRQRLAKLAELLRSMDKDSQVVQGVIECIPESFNQYGRFESVIFLNGFWQVRSDYEALIEVNRALAIGGRFIFNLLQDDSKDIICGRVIGVQNYVRILKEFGFDVYEVRDEGFVCAKKVKDFDPRDLRKLQLVPTADGTYRALNFFPDGRDQVLV